MKASCPPVNGGAPRGGKLLEATDQLLTGRRELVQSVCGSRLCPVVKRGGWKWGKDKYGQHLPSLVEKLDIPKGFRSAWDSGRGLLIRRQAEAYTLGSWLLLLWLLRLSCLPRLDRSSGDWDHSGLRSHKVGSQLPRGRVPRWEVCLTKR